MSGPSVVVIGGGIAGLAAARVLHAAAIEVVVIERGESVGGRVRSVMVDDTPVDLGAQFIAPFATEVLRTSGAGRDVHSTRIASMLPE